MAIIDDVLVAPEVIDDPSGYIDSLITQAQAVILEYCKLEEWPSGDTNLDAACARLAIILYRQGGTEHTQETQIGDMRQIKFTSMLSETALPPDIMVILKSRRRCGWL